MRRSRSASRGDDARPSAASRNGTPMPSAYAAQQDRAPPDLARSRRDRERGREQRTDARAPARAERDADDVGARDAGDRGQLRDEPLLARERPARDAEQREPHHDDHHAADDAHVVLERRRATSPSSPATAPSPANTVVNPAMKISVAGTARAGSCASPISPTMIPRYAGTSGMMHGARNDATPAPNNATICAITRPVRASRT